MTWTHAIERNSRNGSSTDMNAGNMCEGCVVKELTFKMINFGHVILLRAPFDSKTRCLFHLFPTSPFVVSQAYTAIAETLILETERFGSSVTLLTCKTIREVPVLNLGRDTDCPDWGFSSFSSVPSGKCRDSTFSYGTITSFPFHYSLSFSHWTQYIPIFWQRCKVN
jgi:hypothetical protein